MLRDAVVVQRSNTRDVLVPTRPKQRGFTLTELLITLAVMGILVGVAAPSFVSTVSSNRAYATQTELSASLALARSEATRRGVAVYVSAASSVSGNEFGGGWNVWVDQNGDGNFDPSEPVLRSHEALPSNLLVSAGGASSIGYGPMGFLTPASAVTISICSNNTEQGAATITVQANGLSDVHEVASRGATHAVNRARATDMNPSSQRGYGLFESMVSILVVSIGFLGFAGCRSPGSRPSNSSLLRSKAVYLSYQMADRLRANLPAAQAGAYNGLCGAGSDPGCITSGCTPAQMAQNDYSRMEPGDSAAAAGRLGRRVRRQHAGRRRSRRPPMRRRGRRVQHQDLVDREERSSRASSPPSVHEPSRQRGMSLVELMVWVTVSLIIVARHRRNLSQHASR